MGVQRGTQCYRFAIDRTGQGTDAEFKRYHMDVIDTLDDNDEMQREGDAMEEHEDKMAHIIISLRSISSSAPTTSYKTKATIKTESKELEVLRRLLADLEIN